MFGWLRKRETQKVVAKSVMGILRLIIGGAGIDAALSEEDLEQLAGAIAATAMGIWSVWDKVQANREKQKAAETAAIVTAARIHEAQAGRL